MVMQDEAIGAREEIVGVVYPDGREVAFSGSGARYQPDGTIVGRSTTGEEIRTPIDDVLYVKVRRLDAGKSLLATVAVLTVAALAAAIIIAATKESCPFIYSWDGERWVFDAEPLGGSVCEGMRRAEYSEMQSIKPVDGEYRVMVRNEVEETQYLDQLAIVVVDHPATLRPVADTGKAIYLTSTPVSPVYARDENGTDLLPFFAKPDGLFWQSRLPSRPVDTFPTDRHRLIAKFPRPNNAQRASLIVNIGTTLWGSNMIREFLELRGNTIDEWCYDIGERGPAWDQLRAFREREELWQLQIRVHEADSVAGQMFIRGAGPLAVEDRIFPVDLSRVTGDTVTLEFHPPVGFWTIDYLAIDYGEVVPAVAREMPVSRAVDQDGRDVTAQLAGIDEDYYVMPEQGNWCEARFAAPDYPPADRRTVFLKSFGYYTIHMDTTAAPRQDLLVQTGLRPGAASEYAMQRYLEWLAQMYGQ
jgi:hypothetical protein